MTTSANAHLWSLLYRRCLLLVVFLSVALAGTGAAVWVVRNFSAGPIPPAVPSELNEPNLSALLESMRARVVKEPRSASAWGVLGQAFLANKLEDESRVCFTQAERLDPNNPRWPHYQAVILLTQGKQQAALPYLHRAVERAAAVAPDNPMPRVVLAEALLALGQTEEAENHFRQVLARHPEEARAHLGMALAASARQDWPSSRSHLLFCLKSAAARKKASVQLEAVCQHLGQQEEADKYRRQAESLPPDEAWNDPLLRECEGWVVTKSGLYRRATSLETAGRLWEAANVLQSLVAKYPDDYLPRLTLGNILGQLGEYQRAAVLLYDACRLAPDNLQAHYFLSLTLYSEAEEVRQKRGDAEEVEKLYQDAAESARLALALKPDYGFALVTLGLSLKQLGQRTDAVTAFRQAVHCNPELAEAHYYLGEMLAGNGEQGEAQKQLEQALALVPPNTAWRQDAVARLAALAALRSSNRVK